MGSAATHTVVKYVGAVAMAAGWLGNHPAYMGRDLAIPLLVTGIVLFANGLKGELIAAFHSHLHDGDHRLRQL